MFKIVYFQVIDVKDPYNLYKFSKYLSYYIII